MSSTHLSPCPCCRRHARAGEACPFCGASIEAAPPPPSRPVARLGRAAILAFGATLGAGAITSGCSSAVPLYGAPAPLDAGADAAASEDAGTVAPAYGAPAAPDDG